MKSFFTTIISAIVSFEFYQTLYKKSLRQSIGVYAGFLLLVVLAHTLLFSLVRIPQIHATITSTLQEFATHYPSELEITWDGEQLYSSIPEVIIYYPATLASFFAVPGAPEYLGYITMASDVTATPSAVFTVTRTDLLIPAENDGIVQRPLRELLGSTALKATSETPAFITAWWDTNRASLTAAGILALPVLLYIGMFLQRTVIALIESTFFYFFRMFTGSPWKYRQSLTFTLHFFIPAEIVNLVAEYAYPQAQFSFFSLTLWIYFIAVVLYPAARIVLSRQKEE